MMYAIYITWKLKSSGVERSGFYNLATEPSHPEFTTTDLSHARSQVRLLKETGHYGLVSIVKLTPVNKS